MKKRYTKKQIQEAVGYWKKQLKKLNESEDLFDTDLGIARNSARDLIFDDAECLDSDIKLKEVWLPLHGVRGGMPVKLSKEEESAVRKLQDSQYGGYRFIAYIYTGKNVEYKWSYAADAIDDRADYEEYVDPDSENNSRYPEEYDAEFAKAFPTYESWREHVTKGSENALRAALKQSGRYYYAAAADNVRTDDDGVTYVLIAWRA